MMVSSKGRKTVYKTIKISAGDGGWGGPLTITPTEKYRR